MEVKGIDISYCQEGMSIAKAKAAGVKFAIIRAGYRTKEDVTANAHIKGCKANKIDVGFYWYSYAKTVADAKAEAAACLEFLRKHDRPAYGVWFDAEEGDIATANGREVTTDIAIAFMSAIQEGGYPCGLYANPAYLEQFYNKSRIVGKYDIWLAHWTENPARKSRYNYGQIMWQWGLDKSINGGVDGDLCFVDMPARTAEFYKKHGGATAPTPPPAVPETPTQTPSGLKVGDIVRFKGGSVYVSADAPTASVTRGASRCKVTITHRGKHPYHLISEDGKGVYGWVNASDVEDAKAESKPAPAPSGGNTAIKVGDIVQFKGGGVYVSADAPTASVTRGASRCKVTITHNGKHPYHLISEDGKGIYGWVDSANVTK